MAKSTVHFDRPSYLSDEQAWVRALDYAVHAETVATFAKRLSDWLPLFPDASAQIADMAGYGDYQEFREGMQRERDKRFAGEEWAERFGAILVPENAIRATQLSRQLHVPWGAALMRIAGLQSGSAGRARSEESDNG